MQYPIRRYIYGRANPDHTCTGYLVERYPSKVVGRITPLGEIPTKVDDLETFIQQTTQVSLSGHWLETKKDHIHKIRCVLGVNFNEEI